MKPSAAVLAAALVLTFAASPASAALDLPVRAFGDASATPGYASEVIEVQLAPAAARAAHPRAAGPTRAGAVASLGVRALDRLASDLGATFEPEFAGESAPESNVRGGDLTAFHLVHLPAGVALEDALARFRALPEVVSVSPLAVLPVSSFPNDSLFGEEHWLYHASTPRHDIRAPEGWAVEDGDTSIVVAILDTGVLRMHPDLGGTTPGGHGNIWTNWAEVIGVPGVDDDGDGFVDDTWGWDFVTGGCANGVCGASGEDADVADNDPSDFAGHGTLVAGLVGAIANNGSGIAGVVPKARIMSVRMGWLPLGSQRPNGAVRMDFAAQAIRYATRAGARIVNCSFASAYTAGLDSALVAANAAGVTVIVSSGNYTQSNYMATRSDVISVAACDSSDAYWSGSETGPWLDLVADGVSITSTFITTTTSDSIGYRQPSYASVLTGTSFAAPVVSGCAALLEARMLAIGQPQLTMVGVRGWLQHTGDDVSAANPGQPYLVPRVNLYNALTDTGLLGVPPLVPPRAGLALAARVRPSRVPVVLDWSADEALAGAPLVLALHDVTGRCVRRVALTATRSGRWTWDGRDDAGAVLSAGVYFARLATASRHADARVVLLR